MKLQLLYSHVRKALDDYSMINEGDKIAVGISGGKDSLTLLYALAGLRRFYPKHFEIVAITVDLGYDETDFTEIVALCKELNVEYKRIETQIKDILFKDGEENISCSLCARLRKGALNEYAVQLGCNKVAYAHHMDDVIETTMMSQIFEGHYYCFPPVTYLDKMDITVIRPLIYVTEAEVKGFKNKYNLPIVENPCPKDGHTKRAYVKNLIAQIQKENPKAKRCLFKALLSSTVEGWNTELL